MRMPLLLLIILVVSTPALAQVDELRAEAGAAVAAGDVDLAMARLRDILVLEPDDGASHYQLGSLLMDNDGDLDTAQRHFERAAELQFQPLGAAYRLSRIFAVSDRQADALAQLELIADGGFGLINLIDDQSDYDSLREHPRFIAAVEKIRASRFPCNADERHHAFDFWIGDWTVTQAGQFAGTNSIHPLLGHCVIFEQWQSGGGSQGKSFNYYDPGHDHWRQIWISDTGTFIEFTGVARDGGIFYTAETINPADGSVTHHKFEFTQNDDGSVRQFWQTSTDDKANWSTVWDGHYERQAKP